MTQASLKHAGKRRRLSKIILGLIGILVLFSLALGLWLRPNGLPLFASPEDWMLSRHGSPLELTEAEPETAADGSLIHDLKLTSSSGLTVDFMLRGPAAPAQPMPLIVLVGGYRTGRKAVRLISECQTFFVAAIDYPFDGNIRIKGTGPVLRALPRMRLALYEVAPALMLALDQLLEAHPIDPDRVELVGVSLGAPLACVAGALDPRFKRVWAIQGGGDLLTIFDHNLKSKAPNPILRFAASHFATRIVATLAPEDWVGRISPRPFVLVEATSDERIPTQCADLLFERSRRPHERISIPGGHLNIKKEGAVDVLVRIVQDRL